MKPTVKVAIVVVIVILALCVWGLIKFGNIPSINTLVNKPVGSDYYLTGSDYKGNYAYGGAMQLAVNDLNKNILKDKIQLNLPAGDLETKRLLTIFNKEEFTTNDLDAASYYVKSGYGQNTVDKINKESRAKFPSKSFADLNVTLEPRDFIAYAYFLKQIEYATEFDKDKIDFLGKTVDGFFANNKSQRDNVQIVDYKNDDNFIVKLKLKDNSDEIFLAKGFNMSNPTDVILDINKNPNTTAMGEDDIFRAPEVHLDLNRNYDGFINKFLLNKNFEEYYIKIMMEKIKFDMDNKGARVENEAVIVGFAAIAIGDTPKYKSFILDKPYWVIMKRANSSNPYFILGVKNSEILGK